MKLSNNTLKKLIKGACYFEENKGYLTAYHYSKAQLDFMNQDNYDFYWRNRAHCSGGIRIEFKTDSENISFDYKASDIHERANTVDLYINSTLCAIYKIEDKLKGSVSFSMPEGEKMVSIYLPAESQFDIKNFTIDKNYKSIKDKGEKILAIGDSITQGAGPEFSSASYVNALMRKNGYNMLSQGIGGYRYEARDLMRVDGFEPDKIIVFLGTNYYEYMGEENSKYNYEKAVEDFYSRLIDIYGDEIPILNITPLWRNNDVDFVKFGKCIEKIKAECAKYKNITVVDGFELVPNVDECFSDKVHPNAYGSELLASKLAKILKNIK